MLFEKCRPFCFGLNGLIWKIMKCICICIMTQTILGHTMVEDARTLTANISSSIFVGHFEKKNVNTKLMIAEHVINHTEF